MELTLHERLTLLSLLPKHGNDAMLTLYQETRTLLSMTPDEVLTYEPLMCIELGGEGCVRCGSKQFNPISYYGAIACAKCGWKVGLGPAGCLVMRTHDAEGNALADGVRDVPLSQAASNIFIDTLRLFNQMEKLDEEFTLPLWKKFGSPQPIEEQTPAEPVATEA